MSNNYDLNSILDAIDEINDSQKKKSFTLDSVNIDQIKEENSITLDSVNIDQIKEENSINEGLLPITEKLILEAEEYSKKFKNNSSVFAAPFEDVLILDKEYSEKNLEIVNLEQIKNLIIDDLYSALSKKVKKNTLKTIFDLRQKINELEKIIETLSINKINEDSVQENIKINLNKSVKEHNINEEHLINENSLLLDDKHSINEEDEDVSKVTIKTLKIQNSLIKDFERNEKKLRLKIIDLEQDISLLGNKKINIVQNSDSVEKVNKLDQSTPKIERESIFYRENYERLIIENNDFKKKLINSKQQITNFKNNITELEDAFENLNNIISKNSITKINEFTKKITTGPESSPKDSQKLVLSTPQIFDKDIK